MKNISVQRLSRILICLVLVCSLLFNFVFVRAHASVALTFELITVAAAVVVGAVMIGLGVGPQADDAAAFNTAVDSVVTGLNLPETLDVISFFSGGSKKTAVPMTLINDIRNSLSDNAIVSDTVIYPSGTNYKIAVPAGTVFQTTTGDVTVTCDCAAFFSMGTKATSRVLYLARLGSYPTFTYSGDKSSTCTYMKYKNFYFYQVDYYDTYFKSNGGYYSADLASFGDSWTTYAKGFVDGVLPVSPSVGAVAAPGMVTNTLFPTSVPFDSSYTLWANSVISVPGTTVGSDTDDDIPYVPLGLGNSYSETIVQTQEQTQAGTSTITNSDTQTGAISQTWLGQKIDAIASWLSGIKAAVLSIPDAFASWFSDVIAGIGSLGETITNAWDNAIEAILAGIQAIFVPSEDFLTAKVDALRAEFSFADSIITSGQYIGNSLKGLGTEPPVIYLNLADNRGPYDMGGEVAFLDLRWYAEYKPVGDAILSAFLWLIFAWRVYVKVPGIIRGMPGDIEAVKDFRDNGGR